MLYAQYALVHLKDTGFLYSEFVLRTKLHPLEYIHTEVTGSHDVDTRAEQLHVKIE